MAGYPLRCCLCLFVRRAGEINDAETIMNGLAVCGDHMGYAQGGTFTTALSVVIEQIGGMVK